MSIGDAIAEVNGINHFQTFMDKLYSVYIQSAKNQREIEVCAANIGNEFNKIGRIFNVRWVATSFRTVSAVWQNFEFLCNRFENASKCKMRSKTDQVMLKGLSKQIISKHFVTNLALLYDVLCEISIIFLALQKRDVTIVQTDKWIRRTILYLENLKDLQKEKKLLEAASCIDEMELFSMITNNLKVGVIHRNQFLKRFINNMKY